MSIDAGAVVATALQEVDRAPHAEAGAQVSAVIYSLIETAKETGLADFAFTKTGSNPAPVFKENQICRSLSTVGFFIMRFTNIKGMNQQNASRIAARASIVQIG